MAGAISPGRGVGQVESAARAGSHTLWTTWLEGLKYGAAFNLHRKAGAAPKSLICNGFPASCTLAGSCTAACTFRATCPPKLHGLQWLWITRLKRAFPLSDFRFKASARRMLQIIDFFGESRKAGQPAKVGPLGPAFITKPDRPPPGVQPVRRPLPL